MGVRNGAVDRARRRVGDDLHHLRSDLGTSRRAAGLSLEAVGQACGIAGSTAQRIEAGRIVAPDLRVLAAMAACVGLELRVRAYPAGDPIRDAAHQRLLQRFHMRVDPALRWQTEVGLPIDGDKRAWDGLLSGRGWRVAVEAETVLDDLQALERRIELKRRDGGIEHVVLVVADTRRNRQALRASPGAFAAYARNARAVLRAIRAGADPGCSAIVLL